MPFAPVNLRLQRLLLLLLQVMLQVPRDMQRGYTLGATLVNLTEQKEMASERWSPARERDGTSEYGKPCAGKLTPINGIVVLISVSKWDIQLHSIPLVTFDPCSPALSSLPRPLWNHTWCVSCQTNRTVQTLWFWPRSLSLCFQWLPFRGRTPFELTVCQRW